MTNLPQCNSNIPYILLEIISSIMGQSIARDLCYFTAKE